MSEHKNWECQGRQEHGWFGTGTCDTGSVETQGDPRLRGPAPDDPVQRMIAVAHGAIGHLPERDRQQYSMWLEHRGKAELNQAMRNWIAQADRGAIDEPNDGDVSTAPRLAVQGANAARTQGALRDAAEHLAQGYQIAQSRGGVSGLGAVLGALFGIRSAAAQTRRSKAPAPYPSADQLAAIIYNETSSLYQIPGGPGLDSLRLAIAHVVLNRFDIGETGKVAFNTLKPQEHNAIFRHRVPTAIAAYESSRAAAITDLGRWVPPDNGPEGGLYYNNRSTGSRDPNTSTGRPRPFLGTFGPYANASPSPHAPAENSYFAFFGDER